VNRYDLTTTKPVTIFLDRYSPDSSSVNTHTHSLALGHSASPSPPTSHIPFLFLTGLYRPGRIVQCCNASNWWLSSANGLRFPHSIFHFPKIFPLFFVFGLRVSQHSLDGSQSFLCGRLLHVKPLQPIPRITCQGYLRTFVQT
jgi:hypothetical protein